MEAKIRQGATGRIIGPGSGTEPITCLSIGVLGGQARPSKMRHTISKLFCNYFGGRWQLGAKTKSKTWF